MLKTYRALFAHSLKPRVIAGGLIARFYPIMTSVGFLSLYQLLGMSYLVSGIGAAIVQASFFIIGPRVSHAIDLNGQRRAGVPCLCVGAIALAVTLASLLTGLPLWVAFAASAFLGVAPQPSTLVRARWSCKLAAERLEDPLLKTAFAFEGILDDVSFMFAPSLALVLNYSLSAGAGLLCGMMAYLAGMALLLSDVAGEPVAQIVPEGTENRPRRHQSPLTPSIAVLVSGMFLLGVLYGILDQATLGICSDWHRPDVATLIFLAAGFASIVSGFVFGMVRLSFKPHVQALAVASGVGALYASCALVADVPTLLIAQIVGSCSYAPFIITLNTLTEGRAPHEHVTEALTWLAACLQLGMAVGPVLGGIVIDAAGSQTAFVATATTGLAIPALFLVCLPVLKRDL